MLCNVWNLKTRPHATKIARALAAKTSSLQVVSLLRTATHSIRTDRTKTDLHPRLQCASCSNPPPRIPGCRRQEDQFARRMLQCIPYKIHSSSTGHLPFRGRRPGARRGVRCKIHIHRTVSEEERRSNEKPQGQLSLTSQPGCCFVVVFFTLTDRSSTIPSNMRGCQSGTWSAEQKEIIPGCGCYAFLGAWLRAGEGIGWLAAGTMPNIVPITSYLVVDDYRMPLVYLSLACVFCYSCSFLFVVFCVFVFFFCSH